MQLVLDREFIVASKLTKKPGIYDQKRLLFLSSIPVINIYREASVAVRSFSLKQLSLESLSPRKGNLFSQNNILHSSIESTQPMMESIEEESIHSQYGQRYPANMDAIREHEYPLLNGIA